MHDVTKVPSGEPRLYWTYLQSIGKELLAEVWILLLQKAKLENLYAARIRDVL